MTDSDLQRKSELLELHKQRKHELDKQAVLYGASADPYITIERQQIDMAITKLEQEIAALQPPAPPPLLSPNGLILDVSTVLDFPMSQLEQRFGKPIEVHWRKIGSAEEIPDGGETREYQFGPYRFDITYDKTGIAKGVHLHEGLEIYNYQLEDWPDVLARVGLLSVMRPPDVLGLTNWTWMDHLGYRVRVGAQRVNGPITGVRIYKLPK